MPDQALQALTAQMDEMKVSVEGLEKERDFYFNKVRFFPCVFVCGWRGECRERRVALGRRESRNEGRGRERERGKNES